jgi:hypothetical protein
MSQSTNNAKPSQEFVPIEQVHDGIVVLKDGSLRAIVMASSINMVLKSTDEQTAILGQFENFLNSLDFSIQIFLQSRELDIRPYLTLLEQQLEHQQTELMKIQIREYMDFVKSFVAGANIMKKGFYVVIPYSPPSLQVKPKGMGLTAIFASQKANKTHITKEVFDEYHSQIEQRISVVVQGLSRTGVRSAQLGTEEIIELFYRLFNIGEVDRPISIAELSKIQ